MGQPGAVGCRVVAVALLAAVLRLAVAQDVRITTQQWSGRPIHIYRGYQDVEIFHYTVPDQSLSAVWNFTAREIKDCDPRNVSIYLKQGSYPVINPDNAKFPQDFRTETEVLKVRGMSILSDGLGYELVVDHPAPGDWFAIAFLDVDNTRIEQKGIAKSCSTIFSSKLDIKWTNATILLIPEVQYYQGIQLYQKIEPGQEILYKFFVPVDTHLVALNISKCTDSASETEQDCSLRLLWRARGLPSVSAAATSGATGLFNCSSRSCVTEFVPLENEWHYLSISTLKPINASYSLKVIFQTCASDYPVAKYLLTNHLDTKSLCTSNTSTSRSKFWMIFRGPNDHFKKAPPEVCLDRVGLFRKNLSPSFAFLFDLLPDANGTSPLKAVVSTLRPSILSFYINPKQDIGGNMWLDLGIDPTMNISGYNLSFVACFSHQQRFQPKFTSPKCDPDDYFLVEVNSTRKFSRAAIPYPDPGTWNVVVQPFCSINNSQIECPNSTMPLFFTVMSSACVYGSCGSLGKCTQYVSGGFIFSTCVCHAGYKGWGCTDASEAIPSSELLMTTLLLTLSNLLFIPSIVLAIYRRYFTEALVYVCTMIFSTFYHACDEDAFSFCLIRLNVLQFCDFYSAILAFWVTLIAMSELPPAVTSLMHMAGAITVALGIEYDRYGLFVFMVPVVTGLVTLIISWTVHCRKEQGCYPSKKYWTLCIPPGLLLVSLGLVCYAFLQTEENYKFVHSAWHGIMALSIMFLLPFRRKTAEVKLTWRGLQA